MNRASLEHILRASAAITNERDIVVIGSQALLAQFPSAPDLLLSSIEADVFPRADPAKSILIDGAIGELSSFHQTFGYYAHGVDETTATLPPGWQDRLVPIHNENTGGATGWCLEVHDLAASKLAAGRQKDLDFVRLLLREKMVAADTLASRIEALPLPADRRELVRDRLRRLHGGA
jgi:Nucleotidyltransferase of unknown function (DUF6036)